MKPREYRHMLTALRRHLDVVEARMTANDWLSINYERVPSKAGLTYRKAFLKHDQERYSKYI